MNNDNALGTMLQFNRNVGAKTDISTNKTNVKQFY